MGSVAGEQDPFSSEPVERRSTYQISQSASAQIPVVIVEAACRAENLSLTTWSSSVVISNTLHKLDIPLAQLRADGPSEKATTTPASGAAAHHGYKILELGAGTGLTGLSAACIWGSRALLTDLPTIVPGLQANIDANTALFKSQGAGAGCGTLDWNAPFDLFIYDSASGSEVKVGITDDNKFPVVMAADTMYTEDHPELLTRTIATCLSRSKDARVVTCWPQRVCYLEPLREFWRLMEERGLEVAQEGQEYADFEGLDDEPLHEWSVWRWKDLQ
ncbi:rapid response to glucose protein 1 [Apiospora arundinis]|uniref:Rapid response to glucose protein 1 n=1 Tax=Apiospora arundinis TaxID=335852 RepID=A0ABR2J702_9PEZI